MALIILEMEELDALVATYRESLSPDCPQDPQQPVARWYLDNVGEIITAASEDPEGLLYSEVPADVADLAIQIVNELRKQFNTPYPRVYRLLGHGVIIIHIN